jgi:hypothetical protein
MTTLQRNDDEVVKDGERIRVPLNLADGMQVAAHDAFADLPTVEVQAYDPWGRPAGNRPGMCLAQKPAPIVDDRTAINVAYDVRDAMDSVAWRRPDALAPVAVADREQAYEQYDRDQSDAWRKRGAR